MRIASTPDRPELAVLVGLPGAGKTSFQQARFAATHVRLSMDLLRNRRDRRARQLELVATALAGGRSVVVDDVHAARADRAALIALGRRYGATVAAYVLETAVGECVHRNRAREGRASRRSASSRRPSGTSP